MALQIGSTLFVHGGVLPMHAKYGLERINDESRAWMNGSLPQMPSYLGGRQAVVWARDYSAGRPPNLLLPTPTCDDVDMSSCPVLKSVPSDNATKLLIL